MTLRFPLRSRGLLVALSVAAGAAACRSHAAVAADAEGPFLEAGWHRYVAAAGELRNQPRWVGDRQRHWTDPADR